MRFLLVVVVLALAACGGSGSGGQPSADPTPLPTAEPTAEPSTEPTPEPGPTPLERKANVSCVAPEQPGTSGDIRLEAAFPLLPGLPGLLSLQQAPGDVDHWYALLRDGRIVRFTNHPAAAAIETFLDIRSQVQTDNEMGLLGLAFAPDFAASGRFYVHYNNDDDSVTSRFTFNGTLPVAVATEAEIQRVAQPASNHNGGAIAFGQDGYLYVGFGDGGGANDQFNQGQDTGTLLAAMLRLDVSTASGYQIPADNPFVGNNQFAPEIYAYGLRNPWRWSFDMQTGDLWLADVGQGNYEEVNIVDAGDNLGWPLREGMHCFRSGCETTGLTDPILEYSHQGGACSITGGYVYRGSLSPNLNGHYFYADFCTGEVFRAQLTNQGYVADKVADAFTNVAGFGQGLAGEVYVLTYYGDAGEGIYRIVESSADTSEIPGRLSNTGCFSDTASATLAEGVVAYDLIAPLWSDGAGKHRAFAIPDGSRISLEADGDFRFPAGSVLIKTFLAGDHRLETRLYMRHRNGWAGYTYEWLDDGSDALLLDAGKTVDAGEFVHTFPSRADCASCHTGAAGVNLGPETAQLNLSRYYADTDMTANQLDALWRAGYLAGPPGDPEPLAALDDSTASVELRARSYLHSNCSGCHRPGGPAAQLDLRMTTALGDSGTCNQPPAAGDLGLANARLIAPGAPERSVLLERMSTTGDNRMPPLASMRVDSAATAIIESWIASLADCGG